MNEKDLGRWGERRAVAYLKRRGYRILQRNYRAPKGEIDIIAEPRRRDTDDPSVRTVCFVEVKTRSTDEFGDGIDAVNFWKRTRIRNAARHFMYAVTGPEVMARFDIIAIDASEPLTPWTRLWGRVTGRMPDITHLPAAFDGQER